MPNLINLNQVGEESQNQNAEQYKHSLYNNKVAEDFHNSL